MHQQSGGGKDNVSQVEGGGATSATKARAASRAQQQEGGVEFHKRGLQDYGRHLGEVLQLRTRDVGM